MKKYLALLVSALGMSVQAMPGDPRPITSFPIEVRERCVNIGYLYRDAAKWRDNGISPQMAYEQLKGYAGAATRLTDFDVKTAINFVFFRSEFANAGGQALEDQVRGFCFWPEGKYKPLPY